jgi:hypothetical protein
MRLDPQVHSLTLAYLVNVQPQASSMASCTGHQRLAEGTLPCQHEKRKTVKPQEAAAHVQGSARTSEDEFVVRLRATRHQTRDKELNERDEPSGIASLRALIAATVAAAQTIQGGMTGVTLGPDSHNRSCGNRVRANMAGDGRCE